MSDEGEAEMDKSSEKLDTLNDENSRDVEIVENEQSSVNVTEEKTEAASDKQVEESETTEDDIIEGPPAVEDNSVANVGRWCDNYSFVEDEKSATEFNETDPQKLILWAAEKNELETLRKLLEGDPSLVNAKDIDLYTPLHRASYSNNVEVIRILLSYDADVSSKTEDGWQPLHCACKWDSVEAVSLLIQNGADVNAQTNGHITPLHLAASNVYGRRTLELLLWHPHIDPNVKNDAGDTAYDIACRGGPLGALFEILEESVNVY